MNFTKKKNSFTLNFICMFSIAILLFQTNYVFASDSNSPSKPINETNTHSLKYYGAKGDGITDDTDAIKNAFSNCAGSTVYVPAGTYIISSAIKIPSNTKLIGDSDKSIFMAAEGTAPSSTMFMIRDANNVSLNNITISGNISKNTREHGHSGETGIHLLDIRDSDHINLQKCFFIDNVYCALRILNDGSSITVEDCRFTNVDCGVIILGQGDVDSLTIKDSYFDGHYNSEPISLYGSGKYSNIIIHNNIMKNKTYGCSIYCGAKGATTSNMSIIGNKMYDNSVGINLQNVDEAEVAGNTINFSGTINAASGRGMVYTNCTNINIHDNDITKIRLHGIYVDSCTNLSLSNNSLTDCGYKSTDYNALYLVGNCKNVTISNNNFTRNDSSLSECFLGVNCSGSLKISNNSFTNCKISIYSDSSDVKISSK